MLTARFAEQSSPDAIHSAAAEATTLVGDRGLPLAGEGAPEVSEFAVAELGASLGMSSHAARKLVGDVLELRHRLPKTWARILDGSLVAWRARAIADRTKELDAEAAAWVDSQVHATAGKVSYGAITRTVDAALQTFDPELAALKAEEQADRRRFRLDKTMLSIDGIVYLDAQLDPVDAADLESAVSAIANGYLDGDDPVKRGWSLGRRKAAALGELARHYTSGQAGGTARVIHLHAHIDKGHLAGTGLVAVDEFKAALPIEQVMEWCRDAGTVVKPVQVLDLNAEISRDGYEPTARQHQQTALAAQTCAFPYCEQTVWSCDTDHITPYDPGGPPGQTTTRNLGKLCRAHHRLKTFTAWSYEQLQPGVYLWTSPHGHRYLCTPAGTTDLGAGAREAA